MLLNCGVGEDSWESLGQQGDQTKIKTFKNWASIFDTAEYPRFEKESKML